MHPLAKRSIKPAIVVLAAMVLFLLVYRWLFWLVAFALLGAVTWWLARPELHTLLGAPGDRRPWLVRLREHRWRPVALPFGITAPRSWVYAGLVVVWWWLLR